MESERPKMVGTGEGRGNNKSRVHRIQKGMGISKGKAALEVLKSRSNDQNSVTRPKENVDRSEMPYIPNSIHLPRTAGGQIRTSVLSPEQHRRYVAIIANNLKPNKDFRFGLNKLELKGFDEVLTQERLYFETECLKKIKNTEANPYNYMGNGSRKLLKERTEKRLFGFPPEGFQKVLFNIDWPSDDPNTSGRQCRPAVSTVLTEGKSSRIFIPNPRRQCRLSNDIKTIREKIFSTESVPIESDEKAVKFALDNALQFIMGASTLRSLLVMPWVNRNQSHSYMIRVRQKLHNGRFHKYFIFSKPLISSPLSIPSVQHSFLKWIVKTSVLTECALSNKRKKPVDRFEGPAIKKEKTDDASMNESALAESSTLSNNVDNVPRDKKQNKIERTVVGARTFKRPVKRGTLLNHMDDSDGLHGQDVQAGSSFDLLGDIMKGMDTMSERQRKSVETKEEPNKGLVVDQGLAEAPNKPNISERVTSLNLNDLIGDIINEMDAASNNPINVNSSNTSKTAEPESEKCYSVVDLETEFIMKQRILVRSTNHGVDETGEKICITVKADYLPAVGAERLNREEALSNFYKGMFKSAQTIVNFRVHPQTGNVLQIERVYTKNYYMDLGEADRRIVSQRSERLSSLLNQIKELEPGDYMLYNHDERMELLSQTIERNDETIMTSDHLREIGINTQLLKNQPVTEIWEGIALHTPLVWQIVQGRAPGTLFPRDPRKGQFNKGRQPNGVDQTSQERGGRNQARQ